MKGEREPRSLFLVFAVLLCFAYSVAADSTNQPNIVIIIVDDAGVADTEFSSPSGPIQTPNLASIGIPHIFKNRKKISRKLTPDLTQQRKALCSPNIMHIPPVRPRVLR